MKKRFWKTEYSITLIVIFSFVLFFIPMSWLTTSKQASYISKWNETYDKTDYMFTAMVAQADSEIVKSLKKANKDQREGIMIQLIRPYLRLEEHEKLLKHYHPHYMNGDKVKASDKYYFENLYVADNGHVVGIKDLNNRGDYEPFLMMLFDINGMRRPNKWGEDIYGVNVNQDGSLKPLGYGWSLEDLSKDCSEFGSGVSCSYYYRIGGEFNG